jgi:hypothetical protein
LREFSYAPDRENLPPPGESEGWPKFFPPENENVNRGTSTPVTVLEVSRAAPLCHHHRTTSMTAAHNTKDFMFLRNPIRSMRSPFTILEVGFANIDTGFAVSARCIFVHKNNLACLPKFSCRQVPHGHSEEKASELGFLEPTDLHTPSSQS